jgi:hypothetical protein
VYDGCSPQGTAGGVYFAGAYAVDGMGLLEQGALSAKKVADLIHAELAASAAAALASAAEHGSAVEQGGCSGSAEPAHHAAVPVEPARKSASKTSTKSVARTPRAARKPSK